MSFVSFAPDSRATEMNHEDDLSSTAKSIPTVSKLALNAKASKALPGSPRTESPRDDGYTSQSEFSSTDAGDDIEETFVDFDDFDDFASSCSDAEVCNDHSSKDDSCCTEVPATAATCVYSVVMLLHLRTALCKEEHGDECPAPLRYSTRSEADLPAPAPSKPFTATKARTSSALSGGADDSWWRSSCAAATRAPLPEVASDSWLAQQRKRETAGAPDSDENVLRAARSILNKLTIEKFDSLFQQLVTCGLTQPHHVSLLMREVFEKATTQHHFIPMYADLCVQLEKDPRIALIVDETDQVQKQNFRRLLLNQCQTTFEQLLGRRADEEETDEEHVFRRKQEALGNMKLIGHLLVHGMLSPNLFTECCQELLDNRTKCPEALESLAALIMVSGPKFDHCSWQYYTKLGNIFSDMAVLTKDKSVAPRLRFLIRDVLDARGAGWPSSQVGVKTPAKLEEVRNATVTPPGASLGAIDCCLSALRAEGTCQSGKKKAAHFDQEAQAPSPKAQPIVSKAVAPFTVVAFRRTIGTIFSDLASDKNIPAAVQRVREEKVPVEFQADQFMDMLTRVVEERRGAVRRCELAFLAGLGAAESSAFERNECLAGIGLFFKDVYGDLCDEVHRLPAIMKSEFMPTVLTVFPEADLHKVVPAAMRK